MSNLDIRNLDQAQELDRHDSARVTGGLALPGIGQLPLYGLSNVFASINSTNIAQNPVNIVMSGSGAGGDTTNLLNSPNITSVIAASPVTSVQGGLA